MTPADRRNCGLGETLVDLRLGDCLEILPTLPDNSVDAVITDPPYGVDYQHGYSYSIEKQVGTRHVNTQIMNDDKPFDPSLLLKYKTVVLFGANNFASRLPDSRGWLVWDKRPNMKPCDFGDCELIWTNRDFHIERFVYMWAGVCRQGEAGDKSLHPTQKPIALMKWIIENHTEPADTILDPFMGSGTTGVACVQTGRNFIGIEIEPKYFEIAQKRITEAQLQIRMDI